MKKLNDILGNIQELEENTSKEQKPNLKKKAGKLYNTFMTIIRLQIKFQQSMGSIILQTSKWLEDINLQAKKVKPKKSFLKRIFSRKKIEDLHVFNDGRISPDDVKQSGIGDCYLMAVLISLAKNNPEAIRKCFLQSDSEIEKARIIKVKLHTVIFETVTDPKSSNGDDVVGVVKKSSKGLYVEYTLISSKPYVLDVYREHLKITGMSKTRALWPLIIQEAYSELRKKYYENLLEVSNKYMIKWAESITNKSIKQILDGGDPSLAYPIITGTPSKIVTNNVNYKQLLNTLSQTPNTSVVCVFRKFATIKDAITKDKVQIQSCHGYAITGINTSKKTIDLQEPNRVWGAKGRHGAFTMSFSDFKNQVHSLVYSLKQ